jgi:hypothetical protein
MVDGYRTVAREGIHVFQTNQWKIPANIEYEYKGMDAIAEVKKCYQFMKDSLA